MSNILVKKLKTIIKGIIWFVVSFISGAFIFAIITSVIPQARAYLNLAAALTFLTSTYIAVYFSVLKDRAINKTISQKEKELIDLDVEIENRKAIALAELNEEKENTEFIIAALEEKKAALYQEVSQLEKKAKTKGK